MSVDSASTAPAVGASSVPSSSAMTTLCGICGSRFSNTNATASVDAPGTTSQRSVGTQVPSSARRQNSSEFSAAMTGASSGTEMSGRTLIIRSSSATSPSTPVATPRPSANGSTAARLSTARPRVSRRSRPAARLTANRMPPAATAANASAPVFVLNSSRAATPPTNAPMTTTMRTGMRTGARMRERKSLATRVPYWFASTTKISSVAV